MDVWMTPNSGNRPDTGSDIDTQTTNVRAIQAALVDARLRRGMTYEQVALRAGIATSTYRHLEALPPDARIQTLLSALAALEIPDLRLTGNERRATS